VCPKDAVSIRDTEVGKRSFIDQDKCIRCGKCQQVCPYNAIAYRERPCASACGVDAVISDELGFAEIDHDKCVTCGLCIVSCPFGAIAEKSEIVQIIKALQSDSPVIAEIAPSFLSQFGPIVKSGMILAAIKQLGFHDIHEVAYGADQTILYETKELTELLKKEPAEQKDLDPTKNRTFVGTSCCTGWSLAARKNFPEITEHNISESYTPMVETAIKIKEKYPDSVVVFIGPCIAKKEECFEPAVKEYVDFVLTFEEIAALFQAYDVDPAEIEEELMIKDASKLGRGFPVADGVANAVKQQTLADLDRDVNIPTEAADTLEDCMTLLKKIKRTQFDPMPLLVEGMACPYGCVGGPGTLAPLKRAQRAVSKFTKKAEWEKPSDHISKKEQINQEKK
jgi:[FeFe] hydrogenase (group B1/B3)